MTKNLYNPFIYIGEGRRKEKQKGEQIYLGFVCEFGGKGRGEFRNKGRSK